MPERQGIIPKACEVARSKAINRKERKVDLFNYRPILLPPMISKITERVVHDETSAFLSGQHSVISGN